MVCRLGRSLSILALLGFLGLAGAVPGQAAAAARPLTAEEGARAADAALAYATLAYEAAGEEMTGVPYVWGGRITPEDFLEEVARRDEVPADAGVDASGLVVGALREVIPEVRFQARRAGEQLILADATSRALWEWNVQEIEVDQARAGDLLFFGDEDTEVVGVGIILDATAEQVEFVVASEREGRVIRTFLRTAGEYWAERVMGVGRLLLPGQG